MKISDMDTAQVRDAFTADGNDLNVQAAAALLRNYNDGSLFEWEGVRKHLRGDGNKLRMFWGDLAASVPNNDPDLVYLSSTARFALELAVALATGRPVEQLGYRMCNFDGGNRRVVLDALAIALHLHVVDAVRDVR